MFLKRVGVLLHPILKTKQEARIMLHVLSVTQVHHCIRILESPITNDDTCILVSIIIGNFGSLNSAIQPLL